MLKFNFRYFILTLLLFCIEVLIALFVHDQFVRPYLGDVLVVILIYCFVKSFLKSPPALTAVLVLLFAFTIEFLQYLNFVEIIGLQESRLARTVIGNSFSWEDLVAYTVGIIIILCFEGTIAKKNSL